MEITTKIGCSNACAYCPQEKFIKAYNNRSNVLLMSFEVFKTCIDKIPLEWPIHFSGMCEPYLNPECTKMILYAHQSGHRVGVNTTLVGMNKKDIDAIKDLPFLCFNLHLPSQEGYENININDEYLGVLDKISKSKIQGISYHFHGNDAHPRIKELLQNNGIEIETLAMNNRAGNVGTKVDSLDIENPKRKRGTIACSRNLHLNILLPNGDVILCCMDYCIQHVLGNLLISDYNSLFHGKEFQKILSGLKNESLDTLCRKCAMAYQTDLSAKIKRRFYAIFQVKNRFI